MPGRAMETAASRPGAPECTAALTQGFMLARLTRLTESYPGSDIDLATNLLLPASSVTKGDDVGTSERRRASTDALSPGGDGAVNNSRRRLVIERRKKNPVHPNCGALNRPFMAEDLLTTSDVASTAGLARFGNRPTFRRCRRHSRNASGSALLAAPNNVDAAAARVLPATTAKLLPACENAPYGLRGPSFSFPREGSSTSSVPE